MEFSSDFKELVRSRTDLVQLISESMALTPLRGGAEYQALCPFHDDHNPSMKVYPDRQSFRCWVCLEGGDVYTWVMKRENVSFPEAIKMLAERSHIQLPEQNSRDAAESARKNDLLAALAWAELQYHECFLKSREAEPAREYIRSRGYSQETIERFRIGYHPDDWEWLLRRARGQFSEEALLQARLVSARDNGTGHYDYFVDRVLFPIHDERSRTVAFGGRVIPGRAKPDAAKYWNSPESPVFQKSRILYGLPEAREAIRNEKTALVVEGYADCVACHQFGVKNVVATLGTALTEQHITRLKAFAPKIVMVYDGDEAGQRAAARAVGMLLSHSVDLRVLTLPDQLDPDEYLAAYGTEDFQKEVDRAPEAWEFRLNWEISQKGTSSVNAREQILTEMLNILRTAPGLAGTAREDLILGRLATRLQVNETSIRGLLQKARSQAQPVRPARVDNPDQPAARVIDFHRKPLSKEDKLECELIEILFCRPDLAEAARQEAGVDDFRNPHLQTILHLIYDLVELGELPLFDRVMLGTEDNALKSLCVWIADQARDKGLERKLQLDVVDGQPGLFRQVMEQVKWLREERSHQEYVNRQALNGSGTEDSLARLQKVAAFHSKRATTSRRGLSE